MEPHVDTFPHGVTGLAAVDDEWPIAAATLLPTARAIDMSTQPAPAGHARG